AIKITGIGSHLPSADEDPEFTRRQFETFDALVESLQRHGEVPHIHLANSAGLLGYSSRTTNLVRPGLMLYGVAPLPEHQDKLRTVMTLKSRVAVIRDLPAGHGISYGRTFVTKRPTRVATIGIGYGDGYPRSLSSHGTELFVRGHRVPLLGRVTMDQVMADVTDLPACDAGDEVELFGPHIPVPEVAAKAGTIAWEVFTGITPRVARIYLG
ncbi:MAG: alanine racemase, partial [Akkermansiaceae bacterium]|nr:alanine racemase [Akkermansiaceae bacterium]